MPADGKLVDYDPFATPKPEQGKLVDFDPFAPPKAAQAGKLVEGNPFAAPGPTAAPDAGEMEYGDYWRAVKAGTGKLVQGAGQAAGWVGMPETKKSWQDYGEEVAKHATEEMTPAARAELAKTYTEEDPTSFTGYKVGPALKSPRAMALGVAQSLPAMAATAPIAMVGTAALPEAAVVGLGTVGASVLGRFGVKLAAETVPKLGAAISGALMGGSAEGLVQAGMTGQEVEETILKTPAAIIQASPIYQGYLKEAGGDADRARQMTAAHLANQASVRTGLATAALGAPAGAMTGQLVRGFGKSALGSIGKEAGLEAFQEATQSPADQIIQNMAQRQVDPSVPLTRGAVEQGVAGGVLGGVMGGGMGAVSHGVGQRVHGPKDVLKNIAEGKDANAPRTDGAPPEAPPPGGTPPEPPPAGQPPPTGERETPGRSEVVKGALDQLFPGVLDKGNPGAAAPAPPLRTDLGFGPEQNAKLIQELRDLDYSDQQIVGMSQLDAFQALVNKTKKPEIPPAPSGPAPTTPSEQAAADKPVPETTPEPPRDVAAQIEALADPGNPKDAVFVAKGNEDAIPAKLPEGVQAIQRDEGTLLTDNPEKAATFADGPLTDAKVADILDLPETKEDALASGDPVVVQGKDAQGNVIKEGIASGDKVEATRDAIAPEVPPGGTVQMVNPIEVQQRRAAFADEIARARQDYAAAVQAINDAPDQADPKLLARVAELEKRLVELGDSVTPLGPPPPPPVRPPAEEKVEEELKWPMNIVEFITNTEGPVKGINDIDGILRAKDIHKWPSHRWKGFVGQHRIIREKGKSPSFAKELIEDAGYLPEDSSDDAMYDAIERTVEAIKGDHPEKAAYPIQDLDIVEENTKELARRDEVQRRLDEFNSREEAASFEESLARDLEIQEALAAEEIRRVELTRAHEAGFDPASRDIWEPSERGDPITLEDLERLHAEAYANSGLADQGDTPGQRPEPPGESEGAGPLGGEPGARGAQEPGADERAGAERPAEGVAQPPGDLLQGDRPQQIAELRERTTRYASGMSRLRDLEAGSRADHAVGVEASELHGPAIDRIGWLASERGLQLFVDNGSFPLFKENLRRAGDGLAPKLLDHDAVLAKYDRILSSISEYKNWQPEEDAELPNEWEHRERPNLGAEMETHPVLLAMPDVVGDQAATLALIEKYKKEIGIYAFFSGMARPMLVLQNGELSMPEVYARIVEILGTDNFVTGIPSAAAVISPRDFIDFLKNSKPKSVHILGAASDRTLDPRLAQLVDSGVAAGIEISADANLIRSLGFMTGATPEERAQRIIDHLGRGAAERYQREMEARAEGAEPGADPFERYRLAADARLVEADRIIADIGDAPVVLARTLPPGVRGEPIIQGVLISPSSDPNYPGQWQITRFDADGMSGHTNEPTQRAAVLDSLKEGYADSNRNLLREMARTERFKKGTEWASLTQAQRDDQARAEAANNAPAEAPIAPTTEPETGERHGVEHIAEPKTAAEKKLAEPTGQAPLPDSAAPPPDDVLPRVEKELDPAETLARFGLKVEKKTSQKGKTYWAASGDTLTRKPELDKAGFGKPFRMGRTWYRSVHGEIDPSPRLAAVLLGEDVGQEATSKPGRRDGRSAADDAGSVRDAGGDPRVLDARRREDARPDERGALRDASGRVSEATRALIERGRDFGIPADVVEDQVQDVGLIKLAHASDKKAFLLANEAGTGKTFVLGGAIREMRADGATGFVYLTMNQDLIEQIKRDLKAYGVDDVAFHTYAELSGGGAEKIDTAGKVLIFDETQNIKNVDGTSARGVSGQKLIGKASFSIFASATPFENPVQAEYLAGTGIFEPAGGFVEWAKAFGAAIKKIKGRDADGKPTILEKPYWPGRGKKEDGAAARHWFIKQGLMTQRQMRIDPAMVDVQFNRTDVEQRYVDMYAHVNEGYDAALNAYQDEDGNSRNPKITSEISRHRENVIKRILEAAKVPFAIERAKEHLAEGRSVVMFVETKADRELGSWKKSEFFKDDTRYSFPEMDALMQEWKQAAEEAYRHRERPPPRPFAEFVYELARHFHDLNILYALPSTADEMTEALGGKSKVAIYTGAVTNSQASKDKAAFLAGDKKILIATMAKGGTGLSLHDTAGNRPTSQININLPWTASVVDQVSGRIARYGLMSKARLEWLFASNIPWETEKLAPRVAGRMSDMGAIVKGIDVKAANRLDNLGELRGKADVKQVAGEDKIEIPTEEDEQGGERDFDDPYTKAEQLERKRKKADNTSGGFFETPFPLAVLMARVAGIQPGMRVLEPSAGTGNLLRFVPEGARITAVEQRGDNFKKLSGGLNIRSVNAEQLVNSDFLEFAKTDKGGYDAVIMNPPFERAEGIGAQDVAHVQKAFDLLKPGGRLVAIMGEGAFFRQSKQETAFRAWLDDIGATTIKLPENAFKNSGTGVRTRMIVLDKVDNASGGTLDLHDLKADSLRETERLIPQRAGDAYQMATAGTIAPSNTFAINEPDIAARVDAIARKMIPGARLRPLARMDVAEGEIYGHYYSQPVGDGLAHIIAWSLRSPNAEATVRHEGIHYLRRAGFISPEEWQILSDAAESNGWLEKHQIATRYPTLDHATQIEEAIAEEFGLARRDEYTGYPEPVRRLFQWLDLLRRRIAAVARDFFGKNATAGDVFTRIEAGQVGAREAGAVNPYAAPALQAQRAAFYSALTRTVTEIKQEKGPAPQWANMIRNLTQKGVKQDELDWSGILDWLADQKGNVTKREILDQLAQNEVTIEESMKAGGDDRMADAAQRIEVAERDANEAYNALDAVVVRNGFYVKWEGDKLYIDELARGLHGGSVKPSDTPAEIQPAAEAYAAAAKALDNARADYGKTAGLPMAKYASYVTGGGNKNYRELLLTTPGREAEKPVIEFGEPEPFGSEYADLYPETRDAIMERMARDGAMWEGRYHVHGVTEQKISVNGKEVGRVAYWPVVFDHKGEPQPGRYIINTPAVQNARVLSLDEAQKVLEQRYGEDAARKAAYHGSHWSEKNILAHIRFNERSSEDGKRTLFVEEIQSDWHQAGRRRGYKKPERQLPPLKLGSLTVETTAWTYIVHSPAGEKVEVGKGTVPNEGQAKKYALDYFEKQRQLNEAARRDQDAVPDAPMKTTWHELAMKRALRYAAEHGYDQLAWTTGAQQNQRYNLNKYVQAIDWEKRADGTYAIGAVDKKDPNRVVLQEDNVPADKLEDYVGKEIAQRIIDGQGYDAPHSREYAEGRPTGRLTGLDLEVGGDGMKGFYDKILPSFLNKYAKKWGAKVGTTKIDTTRDTQSGEDVAFDVFNTRTGEVVGRFMDEDAAANLAESMGAEFDYDLPKEKKTTETVHAIDVTPAMRDSVMQGQPLFQRPPVTEMTDQGEQVVMPGAEHVSREELARRKAAQDKALVEQAMKGKARSAKTQKGDVALPLFGNKGEQAGLFDEPAAAPKAAPAAKPTQGGLFQRPQTQAQIEATERARQERASSLVSIMKAPLRALMRTPPMRALTSGAGFRKLATSTADVREAVIMAVAPMAAGGHDANVVEARVAAKTFMNDQRWLATQFHQLDEMLKRLYTHAERALMGDALDEQSAMTQAGIVDREQGLGRLSADQRATVMMLDDLAQTVWRHMYEAGLVQAEEGLPFYMTRQFVRIGADGIPEKLMPSKGQGLSALDKVGTNLTTAGVMSRKYLWKEETEAAGKAALGDDVRLVRDIRSLVAALYRNERAVAGVKLVNGIKEMGNRLGIETVSDTEKADTFTIDHPALKIWRPKLEMVDGKWQTAQFEDGRVAMERTSIHINRQFEGPLRAVLNRPPGTIYKALMSLKSGITQMIMISPIIHLSVEFGRALPLMPGKMLTLRVFFDGNRMRKLYDDKGKIIPENVAFSRRMHAGGISPIGRSWSSDITGIAAEPGADVGRSVVARSLGAVAGMAGGGEWNMAVRRAVDKAGDFWHGTMLWERIADLQWGIAYNMEKEKLSKGWPPEAAAAYGAHLANRYAGALPQESMSNMARAIANIAMFSRTFTLGNIGVMKDMLNGLPRDVRAKLQKEVGPMMADAATSAARRKAIAAFVVDVALFYGMNAAMQAAFTGAGVGAVGGGLLGATIGGVTGASLAGGAGALAGAAVGALAGAAGGYDDKEDLRRWKALMQRVKENPIEALNPFNMVESMTPQGQNESNKRDRIFEGVDSRGRGIYLRNALGKIGEEFIGYMTHPIEMLKRKQSTLIGPLREAIEGRDSFGRELYDKHDGTMTGSLKAAAAIAGHFLQAQLPMREIQGVSRWVTGEPQANLELSKALLPFITGMTISSGSPLGPRGSEIQKLKDSQHRELMSHAGEINNMIQKGKLDEAFNQMLTIGMEPKQAASWMRNQLEPAKKLATYDRWLVRHGTLADQERIAHVNQ